MIVSIENNFLKENFWQKEGSEETGSFWNVPETFFCDSVEIDSFTQTRIKMYNAHYFEYISIVHVYKYNN